MADELRDGASPYEEHVFSLLHAVRGLTAPRGAAGYDSALSHAANVKAALSANPAAWAAWLEACLDANMAHETCTLRIAHLLGAQHAPLLVDLARLRPGVLGTIEAQLRSELGAASDAAAAVAAAITDEEAEEAEAEVAAVAAEAAAVAATAAAAAAAAAAAEAEAASLVPLPVGRQVTIDEEDDDDGLDDAPAPAPIRGKRPAKEPTGGLFGSAPAAAPAAAPDDSYDSPEGRIARANEKRWPVGCKVHVPGYGDATVEGCPPIGPYAGKVRVRYADGSMYHVNPEDLAAPQEPTPAGLDPEKKAPYRLRLTRPNPSSVGISSLDQLNVASIDAFDASGVAIRLIAQGASPPAAPAPKAKVKKQPEKLYVSGSQSGIETDGEYKQGGKRNGRPCYNKTSGDGCIYWDESAWKICQSGKGESTGGWNYSQKVDTPTPPTGAWSKSKKVSESTISYDKLRVEEESTAQITKSSTLTLAGATDDYKKLNGTYTRDGTHKDKPVWRKDKDCAIFWQEYWKVTRSGSYGGWSFSGGDGKMPIVGKWGTKSCAGKGDLVLSVVSAAEPKEQRDLSMEFRHFRRPTTVRVLLKDSSSTKYAVGACVELSHHGETIWQHTLTEENLQGVQLSIDGGGLSIEGGVDVRLSVAPRPSTVELPQLYQSWWERAQPPWQKVKHIELRVAGKDKPAEDTILKLVGAFTSEGTDVALASNGATASVEVDKAAPKKKKKKPPSGGDGQFCVGDKVRMTDTPERECGSGIRSGDECKIVQIDSSGSSPYKIMKSDGMQAHCSSDVFEAVDSSRSRSSSADSAGSRSRSSSLAAPSAGMAARGFKLSGCSKDEVNGVYHPDGSTHNDKPVYKKVGGSRCVYYSGKKGHSGGALLWKTRSGKNPDDDGWTLSVKAIDDADAPPVGKWTKGTSSDNSVSTYPTMSLLVVDWMTRVTLGSPASLQQLIVRSESGCDVTEGSTVSLLAEDGSVLWSHTFTAASDPELFNVDGGDDSDLYGGEPLAKGFSWLPAQWWTDAMRQRLPSPPAPAVSDLLWGHYPPVRSMGGGPNATSVEAGPAMASFSPSESNNPDRLTLSEEDAAVCTIRPAKTWAVTEQALHEGSGSFSFELLDDRKDDEATCFGVVSESKLSSFPKDVHTSSGSNVSGIAYLRSYNGKVAHSGGSQ